MASAPELRLLHIEDDDQDAAIVGRMLADLARDVQIDRARDGAEGMAVLRAAVERGEPLPEIILLDLYMPVMSGEAFLAALRADPRFDDVQVAVLTSERDLDTLRALSRRGAQAVLSKDLRDDEFQDFKQFVIDLWFHGHADPLSAEIARRDAA